MAAASMVQHMADRVFNKIKEYAVLDTVTWTIAEEGEITDASSSKAVINVVMQSLTEEDYTQIDAGNIPKSDVKVYLPREYTLHAGKYLVSTATTQQFIYYPTNNSTTLPSTYTKYEIMKVDNVGNMGQFTPNNTADVNKVYTVALLKRVMASGT